MSFDGLSAAVLTQIDAVCLQFESDLRSGSNPSIDDLVERHGGDHADVLRKELQMVYDEVAQSLSTGRGNRTTFFPGATAPSGHTDSEVDLLESDSMLGPYQIKEVLGRGGMGVVFAAYDSRLNRNVAIKTLNSEIAKHEDLKLRFEREARAVAAISHPQIVELFDVGTHKETPYAVMELLDGTLLETVLNRGRLPPAEVRRLGGQIAEALATAHEAGVIHRDLKPQNIMLVRVGGNDSKPPTMPGETEIVPDPDTTTGKMVKLFDFGLSRVFDTSQKGDHNTTAHEFGADLSIADIAAPSVHLSNDKTRVGVIMGTPGYMAPEQALGNPVTAASDVFSLGCVLHEAFYGKKAFKGLTKSERIRSVVHHEPDQDSAIREQDPNLSSIIDHCLQKDAARRPASASEIAQWLREVEAGSSTSRRNFLVAGATGLSVGAATVATGFLLPSSLENRDILPTEVGSLAVLSFSDGGERTDVRSVTDATPLGIRKISPGEELAGLLVHELAKSRKLRVTSFRPLVAETPKEFRKLGSELEVDALLTGSLTQRSASGQGSEPKTNPDLRLDLQLVSARTGNVIWGTGYAIPTSGEPIQQSGVAADIASVIGDSIEHTAANPPTRNEEAFRCMLDGNLRTDPDSADGLKKAKMCFQMAHNADARFAKPIAGLALTSITLAAQSNREEAITLMGEARRYADQAIELENSVDARLADAMLDWQQTQRYAKAFRALNELSMKAGNRWQVAHQFGLLQIVLGRTEDAIKSLREASKLNPFSIAAKADVVRARWFAGDDERAIREAKRLAERFKVCPNSNGLLVDLYEQQQELELADRVHQTFVENRQRAASMSESPAKVPELAAEGGYFARRASNLAILPYAPFGDIANRMILEARSGQIEADQLAHLIDPITPMVPLILAAHPSTRSLRERVEVKEILEGRTFA